MKITDLNNFDLQVLAKSLQDEVSNQTNLARFKPVVIMSSVEFYLPDAPAVLCLHKLVWQYDDSAPLFLRTKRYLEHWRDRINAQIFEVRLWIDGIEKVAVIRPDTNNYPWPSNGGPPLIQ